jgi:hypothetical protein
LLLPFHGALQCSARQVDYASKVRDIPRPAESTAFALLLVVRKDKRLDEAQDKPNCQERKAFERETLKLEKKLGDHKRDHERDRLLLEGNLNTQTSDKRKHRTYP